MTDPRIRALRRLPIAGRLLPGRADEAPPFVDGLVLGVMVGAAIAGSTLWSRWRSRRPARGSAGRPTGGRSRVGRSARGGVAPRSAEQG